MCNRNEANDGNCEVNQVHIIILIYFFFHQNERNQTETIFQSWQGALLQVTKFGSTFIKYILHCIQQRTFFLSQTQFFFMATFQLKLCLERLTTVGIDQEAENFYAHLIWYHITFLSILASQCSSNATSYKSDCSSSDAYPNNSVCVSKIVNICIWFSEIA